MLLQLILNRVLMLGSTAQTIIGRPVLPDVTVHAVVEEHVRYRTYQMRCDPLYVDIQLTIFSSLTAFRSKIIIELRLLPNEHFAGATPFFSW